MDHVTRKNILEWCSIPALDLEGHPNLKIPFRLCEDSSEMGLLMAHELVDEIRKAGERGKTLRAIIPCGPSCWYDPFASLVNASRTSLANFEVFHMDECLDWQGKELPRNHPYSFRGYMERHFYDPVDDDIAVPDANRHWLDPSTMEKIATLLADTSIDLTYGGWGQDGHVAYNQARRHPFSRLTEDDARNSTVRIQDNNVDTIIALAQRTFGGAYQLVPPMSVTLGMKECLAADKVRLWSDTGAWKQTALRIALFSDPTPEYPITLLQHHPNTLITATIETASHPVSIHPEWDFG